jgi:signal transduction histidine kinase
MNVFDPLASSDYFQRLIDQTAILIMHLEAVRDGAGQLTDFHIKFTNQAGSQIINRQPTDVIGRRLSELFQPAYQSVAFDYCNQALSTGQPVRYELPYAINSVQRWFAVTAAPFGDGVLATMQDITAQKQAELDNQRQAERLKFVTDNALTAIGLYSIVRDSVTAEVIDLRYELINQMAERLLGLKADDVVGHTMREKFAGIEQTGIWIKYKELAETGQPLRYQNHYNRDGYDLWYEVQGVRQGELIVLSFLNITGLKQAQEHSEQQADLLQSVIDNSPSAILLFEPIQTEQGEIVDFQYRLANPSAAAITGKSTDELLTSTLLTLYVKPQPNLNDLFERLIAVWQTGLSQQFERYTELNGVKLWANATLVRQGKNVLAVLEFITKLKDAQRQLEQQNSALARSNESLQSFAYIASHDLQEPLRKIQQFGSILKTQYASALDEQGHSFIDRMDSAAQRMSSLIHDLLSLSRLTSQAPPFHAINLNVIAADVLMDLETVVQDKGAIITIGQLPTIQGDALQLRQLFQNLLSNALKFAKTNTNDSYESPRIQITCQQVSGNTQSATLPANFRSGYLIKIIDNGIGFDASQAERIFGAFQRLHSRNQYEGTGIGLAIARKVVDNHGGTITAQSSPGQGAIFTIYLPS